MTFDTCAIGSTAASMKLEGWILGYDQVDSYYCYGWDHISVKLRKDEAIPVAPPTASPVKRHTASPVKDVIDPPVNPDISMTITCDFLDSGIYVPCSNLPWYTAAADGSDCVRLFKFTYTIYNNHYSAVLLQGLIDESTNSNLLDADAMGLSIGYRGHYSVVKTESIDICRLNGSTVTKQAVAVAAGIPDFYPGTAIDTYALFIPRIAPAIDSGSPALECFYNNKSCDDYEECFQGEVDFKYTIKNVGIACYNVEKIEVFFNNGGSKALALDDTYTCSDLDFCPYDVLVLTDKRFVDTCDLAGQVVGIIIKCDFGTGTGDVSVDWSVKESAIPVAQPVARPVARPGTHPPVASPVSLPDPVSPTIKDFDVVCGSRAYFLQYTYTGGSCGDADNDQQKRQLKGGSNSYSCEEGDGTLPKKGVSIVLNGQAFGNVDYGKKMKIDGSGTTTTFTITSGNYWQTVSLHSSCSGSFAIGDSFGALTLTGFENKEGRFGDFSD